MTPSLPLTCDPTYIWKANKRLYYTSGNLPGAKRGKTQSSSSVNRKKTHDLHTYPFPHRKDDSQNHKIMNSGDFAITKSNIFLTVSRNSSIKWEVKRYGRRGAIAKFRKYWVK